MNTESEKAEATLELRAWIAQSTGQHVAAFEKYTCTKMYSPVSEIRFELFAKFGSAADSPKNFLQLTNSADPSNQFWFYSPIPIGRKHAVEMQNNSDVLIRYVETCKSLFGNNWSTAANAAIDKYISNIPSYGHHCVMLDHGDLKIGLIHNWPRNKNERTGANAHLIEPMEFADKLREATIEKFVDNLLPSQHTSAICPTAESNASTCEKLRDLKLTLKSSGFASIANSVLTIPAEKMLDLNPKLYALQMSLSGVEIQRLQPRILLQGNLTDTERLKRESKEILERLFPAN